MVFDLEAGAGGISETQGKDEGPGARVLSPSGGSTVGDLVERPDKVPGWLGGYESLLTGRPDLA